MRVLALPRYGRRGPSSRIRCFQYLPLLRDAGLDIDVSPLFRDAWLESMNVGHRPSAIRVGAWYADRLGRVLRSRRYDVLWVGDELFPGLPAVMERVLKGVGVPYVVEYDDAIFHRYDRSPSGLTRRFLGAKIDAVMAHAAVVIAGNDYLADRANRAGARRIEIIPSAVDATVYQVHSDRSRPFTVGWVGSSTTTTYLNLIAGPLREAAARGARIVVLGARRESIPDGPFEVHQWVEAAEAAEIAEFDVGVMPLADGPWERGKCGFKLIQYMASGCAVVASAVGANRAIVQHGVTGFLAETDAEWSAALRALADDAALRRRMGEAGRTLVEQRYSIQINAPRLAACLRSAAALRHGSRSGTTSTS